MTQGKELRDLFALTYGVILENLKDVDHEESLQGPGTAGNCINWILGHVLQSRDRMLALLDQEPVWTEAEGSRYARGAPPLEPGESPARLEKMSELLAASQERLLAGLEDEDALARETGEGSLGSELFRFNFHESYHAGQLGILRRMAGKQGSIP